MLKENRLASFHLEIKSGKKGSALRHSLYIAREGAHALSESEQDLVAAGHGNLPAWAGGSTTKFWSAADKRERKNGAVYREQVIALPRELTVCQNQELVATLIAERLGDKTYQYAIHCPHAAIEGGPQPHVHVMYSDRLPDGIDRSPAQHFRRYNPACPERGGCRKDGGVDSRSALRDRVVAERAYVANLQNTFLAAYGHDARVDHRSHALRGIKAPPEAHLGPDGVRGFDEEDREHYQAQRAKSGLSDRSSRSDEK
jgi:hypothetical protein